MSTARTGSAAAANTAPANPQEQAPSTKGYFDLEKANLAPFDYDPTLNAKPCSPFYNHDLPRQSVDIAKNTSQSRVHLVQIDTNDLEAGVTRTDKSSLDVIKPEPTADADGSLKIWPGRLGRALRMQRRPGKRSMCQPKQRGSRWLPGLTKGQRLMVKILIALVIIGAMVGIGVGISIAVGGGVYKNDNQTSKIGS